MKKIDPEVMDAVTDLFGYIARLHEMVDERGSDLVARVIDDGFADVFLASDEQLFSFQGWEYLPADEALRVMRLEPIPADYRITEARGAVDPQGDPTLICRYAANEPDAIAEVRAQHGRK